MEPHSQFEVLGIGTPIIDHVIPVTEAYLQSLHAERGSMQSVDYRTVHRLVAEANKEIKVKAGGSAANMVKGLSRLGHSCAFLGKIGQDDNAAIFVESLQKYNVKPCLQVSSSPTGQLACLVLPDGERTFVDYLGAGKELTGNDLTAELFAGVKWVHIEGYTLLNDTLTQRAMELAKEAGAKISFDLSNFEIVKQYKDLMARLLAGYVDIVFGNADEVRALTGSDPKEGCSLLKDICDIAVVLMGPDGCWIGSGKDMIHCYAYPVVPLDTTGAGDLFTAGFLHGYLIGKSMPTCAHYGALVAAAVVRVYGSDIPDETWDAIREDIQG